ncbi:small, acid-soluble spore protein, alpha/beta type [Clostridium neuense]|uniref:Small, acid-soluble spore protein, alpha/beta type n=1 Tax=Clostridium neuense TaxID=1728934 RepID=A0ABW8T924_9CLOT
MSHRPLVPGARGKLEKLKEETANEIGIRFNEGYGGNVASKSNGYVGGPVGGLMTKKMVEDFEKKLAKK